MESDASAELSDSDSVGSSFPDFVGVEPTPKGKEEAFRLGFSLNPDFIGTEAGVIGEG